MAARHAKHAVTANSSFDDEEQPREYPATQNSHPFVVSFALVPMTQLELSRCSGPNPTAAC
jgi:hypothetical protein